MGLLESLQAQKSLQDPGSCEGRKVDLHDRPLDNDAVSSWLWWRRQTLFLQQRSTTLPPLIEAKISAEACSRDKYNGWAKSITR